MEKTKKGRSEEEVDRISNLPNSIQSLIVSFLPFEYGIRTRILSKDWRHACASFSDLNFNQYNYYPINARSTKRFTNFVNHTLSFHDGLALRKFTFEYLTVDDLYTAPIGEWISLALHHNVQQLVLLFYGKILDILPPSVFTCPTLTLLSLHGFHLRLPTSLEFRVLKYLTLVDVKFYGRKPLDQLIPSCPVLEKLDIMSYSWENHTFLNIITSTLKSLKLIVPDTTIDDIKISAANLHTISYLGKPPDINPDSFTSMDNASFFFSCPSTSNNSILDTLCRRTDIIFRGQHNFIHLALRGLTFEYLSRIQDLFSRPLTSCISLKTLIISMCCSKDYVNAILFLLKNCPNLEDITIFIQEKSTTLDVFNMGRYSESQELAARSNLKHLKTARFYDFGGSQSELYLARYLLENAYIMMEMEIKYSHKLKENEASQRDISQKFRVLTKASPHAVISFSYSCT